MFYVKVPNEFVYLEFTLPLLEMFLKSSTGGVWNLNGVTQLFWYMLNLSRCVQNSYNCLERAYARTWRVSALDKHQSWRESAFQHKQKQNKTKTKQKQTNKTNQKIKNKTKKQIWEDTWIWLITNKIFFKNYDEALAKKHTNKIFCYFPC